MIRFGTNSRAQYQAGTDCADKAITANIHSQSPAGMHRRGLLSALATAWPDKDENMKMSILIVTGIEGASNCAATVEAQLEMKVEVATGRKAALAALRRQEFAAVVVDETMAECDPSTAEAIWEHAGLAIPLQINFALSGAVRLIREIRAALHRRNREQTLARRAAAAAIETELKSTLAGLLLHSQLALKESEMPPVAAEKMRMVADLAGSLRQQLSVSQMASGETAA
jgi:hypothetical protein